jgi:hypothetical protein
MQLIQKVYALTSLPVDIPNPLESLTSFADIFGIIFNLVVFVGYSWSFVSIALGLVSYVMSTGSKEKIIFANRRIFYGLIGFLISSFAVTLRYIIPRLLTGSDFTQPGITP